MLASARWVGWALAGALSLLLLPFAGGCGSSDEVILAVGTTVQDSGLLDSLVPYFESQTGYHLKVVAVGTGQALKMGERGDADVLLVHSPQAEEQFVAGGYGVNRRLVMHNDFIIVGPADDPAGVANATDALDALRAIAASESPFISRGDDSGTHKLELAFWDEISIDPGGSSWYSEAGQGMAATLQIASQRDAYTMSDRGTYLAQSNNIGLAVLFQGDQRLLNVYHVMQVNPDRFDDVNEKGARAFVEFMVSDEVQALIGDFGVDEHGRPLFTPDAGKPEDGLTVP